jgi:membrane protein implicated in regulation of membrane protease activity
MRDDWMGGLVAVAVAAPVMIVCCGGGGVLLAGIMAALGGLASGLGWIAAGGLALAAAMLWRRIGRRRRPADCCTVPEREEAGQNG